MVVHLIEGTGGQPEGKPAESILNIARAAEGDKLVAQDGVALFGVDAQHQAGKAGHSLQPFDEPLRPGQLAAIDHQAHQHLAGHRAPAHIDVAQQAAVGFFVIRGDVVLVYIIYNDVFDPVGFLRQDQTALVFHHTVGAGLEEARVHAALLLRHGILGLVAVKSTGGGGEDLHLLQAFAAQAVEALAHPFGLQPCLFFIIHMPEIAAAAAGGDGTFPLHTVGGFLDDLSDPAGGPGLAHLLDANLAFLPHDGVGDEYGTALHPGHTLALCGVVQDLSFVSFALFQHYCSSSFCSMQM